MEAVETPSRPQTGARGSGRTWDAVARVPDGGVFVIRHIGFSDRVRDILAAQDRSRYALTLVQADWAPDLLPGLPPERVGVDPDVWGACGPETTAALGAALGRARE